MEVGLGLLSAPRPRQVVGARPAPRRAPSSRAGLLLRGQSSQAALSWEVGGRGKAGVCPQVSVRGSGDSSVLLGGQKLSLE